LAQQLDFRGSAAAACFYVCVLGVRAKDREVVPHQTTDGDAGSISWECKGEHHQDAVNSNSKMRYSLSAGVRMAGESSISLPSAPSAGGTQVHRARTEEGRSLFCSCTKQMMRTAEERLSALLHSKSPLLHRFYHI